jgi:ABC-2 type transport system permease protein
VNWNAIFSVVRRDLAVVARSRTATMPIIILPVIFFVVLPAIAALVLPALGTELDELMPLIDSLPPPLRDQLGDGPAVSLALRYLFEFQFVTLFLLVPLMVAAVIAADSLAGEKERKTLEALLYTPTTDAELYIAKLLGPWLAAVAVSLFGYVLFVIATNLLSPPEVTRPIAISPLWAVNILWLMPSVAAVALGALVLVSARVRTFLDAYQMGATIVLPLVILLVAQFTGIVFLDVWFAVALGAVVWLVAIVVLRIGYRFFRRERLLLTA